ncbi:description family protein, partial [Vibrio parahaemolyticus AQ3810]
NLNCLWRVYCRGCHADAWFHITQNSIPPIFLLSFRIKRC